MTSFSQMPQHFNGDGTVTGDNYLASAGVYQVFCQDMATNILNRHFEFLQAGLIHFTDVPCSNTCAFLNNGIALRVTDGEPCGFTTQAAGDQVKAVDFTVDIKGISIEELLKDFLSAETQRAQKNCRWQFSASVDTGKHTVFWVKFKIQPGAAHGDNPRRVQQLA